MILRICVVNVMYNTLSSSSCMYCFQYSLDEDPSLYSYFDII